MEQVLLTPEEIKEKYLAYYTKRFNSETEAQDFVENLNTGAGEFIAQAQVKKVDEVSSKPCHHIRQFVRPRRACERC